ncbi:MAG: translation initiation factor IF-2 [Clostridia bacterium]|nr:translation initiation factor IF-2 [Clostridia bacterium]
MAEKEKKTKYESVEKVKELLDEQNLGRLQKSLSATEGKLSEILKKLTALETEKAEKEAELARIEAERLAKEEAEKARKQAEEAAKKAELEAEKARKEAAEKEKKEAEAAEEKPAKKRTTKKATEEVKEEVKEEKQDLPVQDETPAPVTEQADEKKADGSSATTERPSATPTPVTRPAGAKRPPMRFVNGQAVGVYVAKPGADAPATPSNTFRPRPQGDRPARPQNGTYQPRQGGTAPTRTPRPLGGGVAAAPILPKEGKQFSSPPKKKFEKTYVEKKPVSKRTLIKQQGMTVEDFDEDKSGYRKLRTPKKQKQKEIPTIKIEHAVVTTQDIPIKVLSEKLGISAVEITKRLFKDGIMKSINDSIDYDNAALIALDMGIDLEYKPEKTAEDVLEDKVTEEDASKLVTRAPVVTVMGHVDHGKTSLLDKIRSTSVTSGEAGGITQSIGAYTVTAKGKQITFIDTPGHAAFTAMRARGAQVTDIVILVVAADDGIMPQTVEAINHAKAANVPIIVAMNKMDKHEVNPDRVKQELLEHNLVTEEWGGDTIIVPVSAKTGMGIDDLLDSVNLVAEMQELTANPDRAAKGTIIEAKLDKGKGPVASIIVQTGTLRTGDNLISGTTMGRVRAMFDDKGRAVKSAGPSTAVSILGLEDVPNAGDSILVVDQALMKQVQEERKNKERENMIKEQSRVTLDDVFAQVEEGKMKNLNLIVKGDVQGSVEAVKQSLEKLSNEEVRVKVIHAAAGAVNESDVMLADSANAIIIGFNVRPDTKAKKLAETSKVDVRSYRIIYELLDDMELALKGMLAPKLKETLTGKCEVRQTFNITGVGTIAGCYVIDGKIVRGGKLRIYREDIMICEGGVKQLKRFKDDVKEVNYGFECGCAIDGFNEIRVGDVIECYVTEEVKSV